LTPEDFRPGVRNKKLDTLALNHQGLVVAGSNTGEMFVWRVNYQNVARRQSKNDCYRYLGQQKLHKHSGIQFCEFSPKNGVPGVGDFLMTGSTDGIVKIWKMNVGAWRTGERDFSMDDKSRLWLEIDENRGCLETVTTPNTGANAG
jgi:WD40 repeat protein